MLTIQPETCDNRVVKKLAAHVLAPIILTIILSGVTYVRNKVWYDEARLWEDVVGKSPNIARGHYTLGSAYKRKGWIDKCIEEHQAAVSLDPDFVDARLSLGFEYYYFRGLIDDAIEQYEAALKLDPGNAKIHLNLGIFIERKDGLTRRKSIFT